MGNQRKTIVFIFQEGKHCDFISILYSLISDSGELERDKGNIGVALPTE